jgi:decaprenyl-phosphate phosphoribosyltransferase
VASREDSAAGSRRGGAGKTTTVRAGADSRRSGIAADLISLARPRHWIKSVFILLPVPFAAASGFAPRWSALLTGSLGFCLISSSMYVFNDACDAARDALHPVKRLRPIASGRISRGTAAAWCAALFGSGMALGVSSGSDAAPRIIGIYTLLNVAYSLGAKNVALIDVFILASGFLLRVLLGCALVSAEPSQWLLLCASSLALFLAFAKRRADLVTGVNAAHRPSLAGYTETYLNQAMALMAGVVLVSYGLYCFDAPHLLKGREFASLPFVAFGLLDYLRLAYLKNEGISPVDLVLSSPAMLLCGFGWLASVLWSLGIP